VGSLGAVKGMLGVTLSCWYRQAGDDRQRSRVALRFEKICRATPPAVVGEPNVVPDVDAAVELYEPEEPAETYAEMMARVWGRPVRRPAPFVERGWDPAEGSSRMIGFRGSSPAPSRTRGRASGSQASRPPS
jgi:hypothetical protein